MDAASADHIEATATAAVLAAMAQVEHLIPELPGNALEVPVLLKKKVLEVELPEIEADEDDRDSRVENWRSRSKKFVKATGFGLASRRRAPSAAFAKEAGPSRSG